jgi:hypothetical protein
MDDCGFKFTYGGGEMSLDCVEPVFLTLIKTVRKKSKLFSLSLYNIVGHDCLYDYSQSTDLTFQPYFTYIFPHI